MTTTNTSIVAMYEDLGLSVEEISAQEGYDIEAIKLTLLHNSQKYRDMYRSKTEEKDPCPQISKEELNLAFEAYKHIAFSAEDESVRERALRNIINEKKGRNDVNKLLNNTPNINIIQINEAILKTREALKKVRSSPKELEAA